MQAAKQTKTAGAEAVHHIEWLLEAATMYIQSPQYYAYTLVQSEIINLLGGSLDIAVAILCLVAGVSHAGYL